MTEFQFKIIDVDEDRFCEALNKCNANNDNGNVALKEQIKTETIQLGEEDLFGRIIAGLSTSSCSNLIRKNSGQTGKPRALAVLQALEALTGIDASKNQTLHQHTFTNFEPAFQLEILTVNHPDEEGRTAYELKDLYLEFSEINDTVVAEKDGLEIDVRLGLDQVRLSIDAADIKFVGEFIRGETPRLRPEDGETEGDRSWFKLRLPDRTRVSWLCDPHVEGRVLVGRVDEETLCRISAQQGAAITALLSYKKQNLKVRIVKDPDPGVVASHTNEDLAQIREQLLERMASNLIKHNIAALRDENVFFRKVLK